MVRSDEEVDMSEVEDEQRRAQSGGEDESEQSSSSSSESDASASGGSSASGSASGSGSGGGGGSVAGSGAGSGASASSGSRSGSRSASGSGSSSGGDSGGEDEVNNKMDVEEEEEEDEPDLFSSDNEDYHRTSAVSTLPIPSNPSVSRHPNNVNRSNSGRGRWQSGIANDRGPPLLPLPGPYQHRKFQGSGSGSSKFQQGARRPEGLVAELKLSKNEETLAAMKCPVFQQPSEIACYSRVSDGNVYYDDRCLRPFGRHILQQSGADLNEGFETFVQKREDLGCHGFGDMLACIRNKKIPLDNIHFVTFRNNLNKILETAYNRSDPWQMGVHRRNNTVYLDVHKLPERPQNDLDRRRTYWGYSFEHVATKDPNEDESEDLHIVDANVEYCALIRTKLGAHRIIMGAEMDCYDKSSRDGKKYYVELKTSREIEDRRTMERFEKYKLLKYWIQSFIAGVPFIVVGFRDDEGRLLRCKRFGTEEIRKSVKEKKYWQGGVCLAFADEVLCWLYGTVKDDQDYVLQFVPSANRIELLQSNSCPNLITSHVDQL